MKDIRARLKEREQFTSSPVPPFPRNMLVEVTNMCNHQCVFCGNRKHLKKAGAINENLLDRILKEAYDLGTREVGFYTTGEPFLFTGLAKFIARAKEIGYEYTYIDTNGALAVPERAVPVIEAGLDSIKFSINAGTPETYQAIHGHDDFAAVIRNLEFIADYRKKHGKPAKIYASYIVTRENQQERDRFKALVGPLVDDIYFSEVENQSGNMVGENQGLFTAESAARKTACSMVFNRFHITLEGYLTACCVDFGNNVVVADLNKVSLKLAWQSKVFQDLRKRHLENKLEGTLCYNCMNNTEEPFTPVWLPSAGEKK